MALGNRIPDKTVLTNVVRKMAQKCTGASRIVATIRSGEITISGLIQHEHERKPIVRCISAVPGVKQVTDQVKVVKKKPVQ